jgi:hypothetical protein
LEEKEIQLEPSRVSARVHRCMSYNSCMRTPHLNSPEVNGLAERHQLMMQDVALLSLADTGDERHGLKPLCDRFAGYALAYANCLHNAMPASGVTISRTLYEELLGRQVTLVTFCRLSCRCWVHTPFKPFARRRKFELRTRPGRFLGLITLLGQEISRFYWTLGMSRSYRWASLMTQLMCLLQRPCLKGQRSSIHSGRGAGRRGERL